MGTKAARSPQPFIRPLVRGNPNVRWYDPQVCAVLQRYGVDAVDAEYMPEHGTAVVLYRRNGQWNHWTLPHDEITPEALRGLEVTLKIQEATGA